MSRFVSTLNAAAITQPHIDYVLFLELDFVSGTIYCSTADRSFTWGGNTWLPLGKLASLTDLSETTDISSQKLQFTLAGVDPSLINTTLGEKYHNRTAEMYVGLLDRVNYQLIDTPESIWSGLMDVLTISAQPNTAQIILDCENRLVLWNQASGWLYTQEHQRLIDATDNFLDQVNTLASKAVVWGNSGVNTGPGYTAAGTRFSLFGPDTAVRSNVLGVR
ncbi:MAG TPA: hypothetical protein VGF89_00920 [Steroidobacteraceae bacterium]|jgi:hypothetical protein